MPQMKFTFGDYARNVREVEVGFTVTDRGRSGWAVHQHRIGSSILQFGTVGAGTIADGVMAQADSVVLVLQSSLAAHSVFLNGHKIKTTGLAVLVPGSDFLFTNQVPHRWISASVNLDRLPAQLRERLAEPIDRHEATIIDTEVDHFATLAWFAEAVARRRQCDADLVDADRLCSEEDELIGALTMLAASAKPLRSAGTRRDGFHYHSLVRRALSSIPCDTKFHVDDLCRASGIEERTLRRAFHTVFRVPPARYLKLRQLNRVHAALSEAEAKGQLVTEILTRHGVTELGRFAAEYHALFGEPPSRTIRRLQELDGQIRLS